MAKSIASELSEAFQLSAIWYWETVDDIAENLGPEDARNISTFGALDKSIANIPHELMERTIQLRARNAAAFENSLTAICVAVGDTFRPATAAEFLERLNEDLQSEIETGRSAGTKYAGWHEEADRSNRASRPG
jgi:hypothetical protein